MQHAPRHVRRHCLARVGNLNLVADGIIHFRVVAFATNGFRVFPNPNFPNPTNAAFLDAHVELIDNKICGVRSYNDPKDPGYGDGTPPTVIQHINYQSTRGY